VFAGFDGLFEEEGAWAGRGGDEDDVGEGEGFLPVFELGEDLVRRNGDLAFVFLFEDVESGLGFAFEGIDDGDEFDGGACGEGLVAGAGAASSAADEGDFDIAGAVGCEGMSGGSHGRGGEEGAAGGHGGEVRCSEPSPEWRTFTIADNGFCS